MMGSGPYVILTGVDCGKKSGPYINSRVIPTEKQLVGLTLDFV